VSYLDTVTHTLFGMTLYGSLNKEEDSKNMKKALLFTSIAGSQIPDIDVISKLWDTEGMYQMWHRGITHSLFLVPLWALLLTIFCVYVFKVKNYQRLFIVSTVAVFIHNTSDLFNAWGTGYFEPFSSIRITFGTIPIVDFIFWIIMFAAMIGTRFTKKNRYNLFRVAWVLIGLHITIQSIQGYLFYQKYSEQYEQVALSASFLPWNYTVIGKNAETIDLLDVSLLKEPILQQTLQSQENADLEELFAQRPEAKTLYDWSPFVVIVDDDERLGIYDPRFFRNGQSFLFEWIEKEAQSP